MESGGGVEVEYLPSGKLSFKSLYSGMLYSIFTSGWLRRAILRFSLPVFRFCRSSNSKSKSECIGFLYCLFIVLIVLISPLLVAYPNVLCPLENR